jgi:hypothetical protein
LIASNREKGHILERSANTAIAISETLIAPPNNFIRLLPSIDALLKTETAGSLEGAVGLNI